MELKTNADNYLLLKVLGMNLNSKAHFKDRFLQIIVNSYSIFHLVTFGFYPSIYNMMLYSEDKIEILLTWPQTAAIINCTLSYILFCIDKSIVNEVFYALDELVRKREAYNNDNQFYKETIDLSNMMVKYSAMSFCVAVISLSFATTIYYFTTDLIRGEFDIEQWHVPYRFE